MKKISPSTKPIIFTLLAFVLFLNSCATAGEKSTMAMEDVPIADVAEGAPPESESDEMTREEKQEIKPEKPFPYLLFQSVPGDTINSPVSGEVVSTGENGFGSFVIIEASRTYYNEKGRETQVVFDMICGGLTSIAVSSGPVKPGDSLGLAGGESYVTVRRKKIDPYLLRTTDSWPVQLEDGWYFGPDWLIPTFTNTMSFRPVASFEETLAGYLERWRAEGLEPDPMGYTLRYDHDRDRIRVMLPLEDYPITALHHSALSAVEEEYYQYPGLYPLELPLSQEIGDYTPVLYWQAGYDKYLKDEYVLGDPLWLYCSIYGLNHRSGEIMVCVRDFLQSSDEEILEERMEGLGL